jgi:hypothetical protein
MDSVTPADRRAAQRRVGAAASVLFVLLLLLGVGHRPAEASPAAPAATPAPTAVPELPQPGFPHHDRDGDGGPPGFRGGGPDDGGEGGGAPAPAPDTGTNTT